MARRRSSPVASKGLGYYVLFWVAPMCGVVLAPLFLHAASQDLSESTDSHMLALCALLLTVVSLSVLGCVLDEACQCNTNFPLAVMAMQMVMLFGSLLLGPSLFQIAKVPEEKFARFLSRGPLLAQHHAASALQVPVVAAQAAPVVPAAAIQPVQQKPPAFIPATALSPAALSAGFGWKAGSVAPASSAHGSPSFAASVPAHATPVGAAAASVAAASGSSGMDGWRESGDGYCEDGSSRQEFSSLHNRAGTPITLQQCADAGKKDPNSIAFDFAEGECDIRYYAGYLSVRIEGFDWWGWGAGAGNPKGFGKQKHEKPTKCYARIVPSTSSPALKTLPPTHIPSAAEKEALLVRGKNRFSIVLACAAEGVFMVNTVRSFCERTPDHALQEIIVVDDGTEPPLEHMLTSIEPRCRLRVLRHKEILGLMIAKQTGGDAATGEFIGFFDCHVSPNKIWHQELATVLKGGPRRMAVPTITDLDIDLWEEREQSQVNSKCYIDFNAQFMWFDDESDNIPVISGGLVALTRSWWQESGGFDSVMRGWGGENVDQSLRTWLCGGEIIRAKSSRIAHMWRIPSDSRTSAHYKHVNFGVDNVARVAAAWFDKFKSKYRDGMLSGPAAPDVSNILAMENRLTCQPYGFFLHRFRKIYVNGGILPAKVFKLRSLDANSNGEHLCIQRQGAMFSIYGCQDGSWFHTANQDPKNEHKCCSGLRQWNAMECFDALDERGVSPYYCDITGKNENQHYSLTPGGLISHPYTSSCVSMASEGNHLKGTPCEQATKWERFEEFSPMETKTYESEVQRLGLTDSMPDN